MTDGDGGPDPIAPPESFAASARVGDPGLRAAFERDWPDAWARAGDRLDWATPYDAVLDGDGTADSPWRWFAGGELNASANCLDRHLPERKNQRAIHWVGRTGETRSYTYLELHREVNEFAAALRDLGVGEGDVVTLYMPVVPELVVGMLACARLGAPHNVVFAGFSADALASRMERADSTSLVTCDGYYRRGAAVDQLSRAENARLSLPYDLAATVVVDRLDTGAGSDGHHSYDDLLAAHRGASVEPVPRASEAPLFRIYTSGTTGQPTAVTHTTGGYLAHVAWTSEAVLDLGPADTHWCTADIGWITGHSYVVYGPLALGATTTLYEGTADHPRKDRLWELIERTAVDVFYTAPTAIRSFMKWGAEYPDRHDLSSLRLLGTVGEPIDPATWRWYREHVGGGTCPVVDTWWQTETGAILLSTLPGVDPMRPGSVGPPLPGVAADVVDEAGEPVGPDEAGELVLERPWPGMPRELANATGWGRAPSAGGDWCYRTGDRARVDADGYVTVLGRADEVLNVAGRRLGTTELESAIVAVDGVAEAAVIGADHPVDGTAVYAYVTAEHDRAVDEELREAVEAAIEAAVGPVAVPERVVFTPELPKTRSGKVMRRLLTDIANGEEFGDLSALRNPEVVGELESLRDE